LQHPLGEWITEKTRTGGNQLREASLPPVDVVSVISAGHWVGRRVA
jgi:hypothetical protein